MILVNDRQGYRVCLECHEPFQRGDESTWMRQHAGCQAAEDRPVPVA